MDFNYIKKLERNNRSANKNNILQEGEKAFEKEDIIDKNMEKDTKKRSTYDDAGKGYNSKDANR